VGEAVATTPRVVTVKVAVVAPAATTTDAGTVAFVVSELVSVTVMPPVFAFPSRVTVPVEGAPATRVVGFKTRDARLAGLTVTDAVTAVCCFTAEIVTGVAAPTPRVVTANVADVAPAGTVNEVGTVATATLGLRRKMGTPPAGAAVEIVTVPVTLLPPTIAAGASVRPVGSGAVAVSDALVEEVPRAAEMAVRTSLPTTVVVAVNVAVEAAAGTVTDAGTPATMLSEDDRATTAPPVGAGPLMVTVPVDDCPPATTEGVKATERTTGVAVRASATVFVAPP
jgi:hypothetical protein